MDDSVTLYFKLLLQNKIDLDSQFLFPTVCSEQLESLLKCILFL